MGKVFSASHQQYMRSLLFVAAAGLHLAVSADTVADILNMPVAGLQRDGVVTGIVTSVFRWQRSSCTISDPDDPDGAGVYVGGQMPNCPIATIVGAERLESGDIVKVGGRFSEMLLEPGVIADEIKLIGHRELPPPRLYRVSELMLGRLNNRRVAIEGVVWGASTVDIVGGAMTAMRVGTDEGPITVHVAGIYPELGALRNCRVRVEGVCLPMCNARGEFVSAEVEAFSVKSIVRLEDDPRISNLRRINGMVVFCDPQERYCVIRLRDGRSAGVSVRVNVADDANLPPVGCFVAAEGFHTMTESVGTLEEGICNVLSVQDGDREPDVISGEALRGLLSRFSSQDMDFSYRFVKIRARVKSADRHVDGVVILDLETPYGNIPAVLPPQEDYQDIFVDEPLADVTGVLDVGYGRSPFNGRVLTVQSARLKLRSADDVRIIPDAAAQTRRKARLVRTFVMYLPIPLAIAVLTLISVVWRRHSLAAALSADRRRTAEALHDAVSQQLAGARLMVFSVKSRDDVPAEAKHGLDLVVGILESARRDVRDAIMRLKSDENLRRPTEEIIRETAAAVSERGEVRVRTRLHEFPSWVTGEVKTNILAIVQEAMTNAVRHGKAKRIVIISEKSDQGLETARDGLTISILNDGAPFDAAKALGPEAGHFGLSNMRERSRRIGFEITFGRRREWNEVRLEGRGQ